MFILVIKKVYELSDLGWFDWLLQKMVLPFTGSI